MPEATLVRITTAESAPFAIRDLSPAGARLVGELAVFEGERVQLRLALATPLVLTADVTHVDRQRKVVELAFREVDAAALAQIEASIADVLANASEQTILIVHPDLATSSALERDLARVGVGSHTAPTIEAMTAALAAQRFIGIVIAGSFGEAAGAALELVEKEHPAMKRVLLHGDQIAKIDHPAAGRVAAVLRTPWRFKGLARALEISLDEVKTTYDQLVALKPPK